MTMKTIRSTGAASNAVAAADAMHSPTDTASPSATVTADFTRPIAKFRPALHSSGYAPAFNRAFDARWDEQIREMNFDAVRTHDLALVNSASAAFDVQHVFPLTHLDPADPKNYRFATTDFMIDLQRDLGLKTFYRLGTSIEHTKNVHFFAEIPKDFDKMAEIFAGTVRHYAKGWGDPEGKVRPIEYWEIWNEPNGRNMWSLNDGTDDDDPASDRFEERRDLFVRFFVKALKRLKSEFPELKFGGPSLGNFWEKSRENWVRPILRACKAEGVAPDFLSWHYYGNKPDLIFEWVDAAESLCAEEGFPGLEFIFNEWHYGTSPGYRREKFAAPDDMNGITSACFTLTVLSRLQTSRYGQAYYYGCCHFGAWGFRTYDDPHQFNKNFHALKAFGEIKRDCTDICASASTDKAVTAFAARSADGKKAILLVTDYLGRDMRIPVSVKGVEGAKNVQMRVLSFGRDFEPMDLKVENGNFTLVKPDTSSAAFLVTFDMGE